MQPSTSLSLLVTLSFLVSGTVAVPTSSICKVITSALAQKSGQAASATSYCSSVLGIKTQTVTSTSTVNTTITLKATSTASNTITIIAPTVTTSVTTTLPSTSIILTTSTSSAISTSTYTTTVTSGTTTTTTTTCSITVAKRHLEARGTTQCPSAWQSYQSSMISTACSCLSLTTPTSTARATTTSTSSTTSTVIVTNSVTTTPTTTLTSTAYTEVDTTSTVTTTVSVIASTTTTKTVQATATATNNVCAEGSMDGQIFWIGMQMADGYGTGVKVGSFPQAQVHTSLSNNKNNLYYVHLDGGNIFVNQMQDGSTVPANTMLYMQDAINGGPLYFGDAAYIASNGYYQAACQFVGGNEGNNFYELTCYNANGVVLTPATLGDGGIAGLYLIVPAGYSTFDLEAAYVGQV